jgi:hypothetical protein
MRWQVPMAVILVAATAAIGLGRGRDSAAQTPGAQDVTVFEAEQGGTGAFVDNPPHSPVSDPESPRARFSIGDQGYWTGIILDRPGGRRIGRVYGAESVMRGKRFPKVVNVIHAIFRLTSGQVVVDAVVDERHPERVRGAITGGTGAYEGARGTFTTRPGAHGNQDTFHLLP